MTCIHDHLDRENSVVVDGVCPLCLQDENKRLRELTTEMLEWIDKHAGWEYGFDMDSLERLKAKATEALNAPSR